jgi:crotonobetainyl-CoA:carnitine CoA-transferase CaiB-like acyl-CoA transferase
MKRRQILEGIRVLDFTQHVAGPSCTRMMAELGAEVIKVELAPHGEQIRHLGYRKGGRGLYFLQQNRGKKSLCLDAKSARGRDILHRLLPRVDVLIENFAPGAIARLGCGWEEASRLNPELIMCSISTFGQTGPLAELPGYDYIGQAYSGISDLIGEEDRGPSLPGAALGDTMTGAHALAAINGALFNRAMGGGGDYLDITLLDSYFHCHEMSVGICSASDGKVVPRRAGSHTRILSPAGAFRGRDGHVMIVVTPQQWPNFCHTIGRPELIADQRFAHINDRLRNRDALIEIVEAWLQDQRNDAAAIDALQRAHIPVAPILSVPEAMAHPHLLARGTVRTVTQRGAGSFQMPGMPLRFRNHPGLDELEAPYLGEHNFEVLQELLGWSAAQVADLERDGILVREEGSGPPPEGVGRTTT